MNRKPTHEELEWRVKGLEKENANLRLLEQAARDTQRYAESIVETIREPMIVLDLDLKVISANRSFYRIFKVSPEETKGKLLYALGNRQWDIPELRRLLEEILPWNRTFEDFEVEHDFETIGRKTMLLNARRLYSETGKRGMIILAIEDVTDRKCAEEALQKAHDELELQVQERTSNLAISIEQLKREIKKRKQALEALEKASRAFRILSYCNQAVIRATEESALLDEICRIVAQTGGYRLVWVGFAEEDEKKSVCPVAQAGYEEGYLDTVGITWADTERGLGPTGKAIRTGKPCVCENMLTDPDYAPWRNEATRRGYGSSVALPLIEKSRPYGALNIYAAEPNAFDPEEIKLLMELADDLSYGIMALRTRAKQKQTEEELRRNYDTTNVLNSLLRLSLKDIPLHDLLDQSLDLILSIPWLMLEAKAAIFLVEDLPGVLVMKAQKGFSEPNRKACSRVPFGKCHCGMAATMQEIQFSDCLNGRHEIRYEGISPHGDYGIPLLSAGRTLGVMNLCLREGHRLDQTDEEFLAAVSDTLSGILLRREAEERLAKSEEKSKAQYRNIPIPTYTWKRGGDDFMLVDYNNAAEVITHGKIASFVGKKAQEMYQDMPEILEEFSRCFNTKESIKREMLYRFKSTGESRHLDVTYVFVPPDMVMVHTEDISERRQAEEALRESETKYRTLFQDSRDAIVITNKDGEFMDINQSALDLFGYSREEIRGMSFRDLYVDPINGYNFQQEMEQKGFVRDYELRLRRKGGKEIDSLVTVTAKWADDGSIAGYQGIIHDFTERRRLEAQFQHAQKMEAIGTLAGGIAHDFNNLLTTIIGNAELALMNFSNEHPLREVMEEIKKAGHRAASLTRQILAFSRKEVIQPQVLDLNEILTDMKKMLGRLIREDIELKMIPGASLWSVEADPGQMEQVIMNLVVNARDAMPRGGKITIETANVELDEEFFQDHSIEASPGSYVMLAVRDTGIGMDREMQSRIFEPFFTTKERGIGTGLGLSTVYGIVKQNKGFIFVYSEPGQGTTFKVYLPSVEIDSKRGKNEWTPPDELSGSETVLIVEDEDSLRNLVRTVLQQYGYNVLEAQDGEEALRVSVGYEGPIHLLLTDVIMPRMGGHELAERLQPLRPGIRVIYMSGYTDTALLQGSGRLEKGVIFLRKPFTQEELAKRVREVLDEDE